LPPHGGPSSTPPTPPPSPLQTLPPSESAAMTMRQEFEFMRELQKRLELIWDRENEEVWEDCIQFPSE
jgi:hypothetical protein